VVVLVVNNRSFAITSLLTPRLISPMSQSALENEKAISRSRVVSSRSSQKHNFRGIGQLFRKNSPDLRAIEGNKSVLIKSQYSTLRRFVFEVSAFQDALVQIT